MQEETHTMSFNDIFKSSFLESVTEFSLIDTVLGLAAALVIGLFIFVIYKKTLTGVMYSSGFALTLGFHPVQKFQQRPGQVVIVPAQGPLVIEYIHVCSPFL